LCRHARRRLQSVRGVRVLGGQVGDGPSAGPLSFTVANVLSHMIARALSDAWGICARSGYLCAQPLHEHLRSPPSLRVSFAAYNQPWEIDLFIEALEQILRTAV
jgi:cysteine desulfurase/selenocysteine lyase